MAFNPSFTAKQLYATPRILRITDTSGNQSTFSSTFDKTFTGSFTANTKRKVYLRKDDGRYLVPKGITTDYIEWDFTQFIDIDVLDKDYALEIKVIFETQFYPNIFSNTFSNTFN